MINNRLILISLSLSGALSILLTFYPLLDIQVSTFFYHAEQGFLYRHYSLVQFFFISIPYITKIFILLASFFLIFRIIQLKSIKKVFASSTSYIIISAAIAPGFLVNSVLKENIGRARPSQITNFGGNKEFSQAFKITGECLHNCSFSSGHAAMAFYFTAIAYAYCLRFDGVEDIKNYKEKFSIMYTAAICFGIFVSLSRIMMGGHFLSDVTFSCFIVLITNHLLYICWKKLKQVA